MLNQGRQKTEKNRQKAQEAFLKMAHMQRQEAAQQRKEEKRRQEKERIMNEEDPEKARKMEVCAEPGNCGIGVFFFSVHEVGSLVPFIKHAPTEFIQKLCFFHATKN